MHYVALVMLLQCAVALAQAPATISIYGHVYADDTGEPLRGVKLTLTDYSGPFRRRNAASAITDENGAFLFSGLASGKCDLYIEKTGYLGQSLNTVRADADNRVRLQRVAAVSGRIVDDAGEVIENATVVVMGKSYMYGEVSLHSFGFSRTDDRGVYRISNLKPGTYYVRASAPEFDTLLHPSASNLAGAQAIDIATGSDHSGVNFVLRRAPRFKIEGRLIDAETGGPAHAASLRVESADLITGVLRMGWSMTDTSG